MGISLEKFRHRLLGHGYSDIGGRRGCTRAMRRPSRRLERCFGPVLSIYENDGSSSEMLGR
jgi:hypothetical protein